MVGLIVKIYPVTITINSFKNLKKSYIIKQYNKVRLRS